MAESEILRGGQWEPRRFPATGAVHVSVMGPRGARVRLEVEGLGAQLRRQSPSDGAFPLVGAEDGVTIGAVAEDGVAFPGGATADLSLSFPAARRDYLIEQVDISGRRSAPLARLVPEDGQWVLAPVEGIAPPPASSPTPGAAAGPVAAPAAAPAHGPGPAAGVPTQPAAAYPGPESAPSAAPRRDATVPELLGAWVGRRRRDSGAPAVPTISGILLDRSVSMQALSSRADLLRDFLRAFAHAGGAAVPAAVDAPVGGVARDGVGSLAVGGPSTGLSARPLVITDVPVAMPGIANLLLGEARILDILPAEDAFAVTEEIWWELEREDASFDDSTMQRIAPLIDWLVQRPAAEEAIS